MPGSRMATLVGLLGLPGILLLAARGELRAQAGFAPCATCAPVGPQCFHCQSHHCPPPYYHCQEGPPHLKFRRGCPKPICNPCEFPNWGYHAPCWRPWPWPPDWSHCPVPVPAAFVTPGESVRTEVIYPQEGLPTPRTLGNRPGL